MNEEKHFVDGLIVKSPSNAPDFVKAKLSFKLDDFKRWVGECVQSDPSIEWINVEVKEARNGKWYAERAMWKPNTEASAPSPKEDIPW